MQREAANNQAVFSTRERAGRDVSERISLGWRAGAVLVCVCRERIDSANTFCAQVAQRKRYLAAAGGQVEHMAQVQFESLDGGFQGIHDGRFMRVAVGRAEA